MLFKRELKLNLKAFIICTTIGVALSVYIIALTPKMGADMQQILNMKVPKPLQIAFGMEKLNFGSPLGIYAILFSYMYLTFSIYAASMFASIVSKEFTDKTAEFLFSLPVNRSTIIKTKLGVAILYLTTSLAVTFFASWVAFAVFIKVGYTVQPLFLICTALWLGAMFFGAAAYLLSSIYTKSRTAVGLVLGAYLLQVVISLKDSLEFIKYISPFDWFKGADIVNENTLSIPNCSLAVVAIIVCLWVGSNRFVKKDVLV